MSAAILEAKMAQQADAMAVRATGSGDLVAIDALKAVEVFAPGGVVKLCAEVETKARAVFARLDTSTDEGRSACKSLAYKVARSKTGLDDMGKELVAEIKRKSAVIDADRRVMRDRLDALRDEVRKPVDEWEAAEKERVDRLVAALDALKALGEFAAGTEPTVDEIDSRLLTVEGWRSQGWQEFDERAAQLLGKVSAALAAQREAAVKREAERAELERLRQAEADRLAVDQAERLAREQRERDEKIAADAAAEAARGTQERIAAEQRRAEKAEADAKAAVEAERKRVADAKAAEDAAIAARESDRSHRAKINNAAVAALMGAAALTEDQAKAAVKAIASGKISNVTIQY